jgi:branched-chain amino acid transport system substrate-binding protein
MGQKTTSRTIWAAISIILLIIGLAGGYFIGATTVPTTTTEAAKTVTLTATVTTTSTITTTLTQKETVSITSLPTPTRTEIVLGATLPLSGALSAHGQEVAEALKMAAEDINNAGGITVKEGANLKIRLVILDDKSDPTTSVNNLERLINVEHIDALVGGVAAALSAPLAAVCDKYKVPYVTAGVTNVRYFERYYKYMWIVFHRIDANVELTMKAFQSVGIKTLAYWEEKSEVGEEVGMWVKTLAPKYGMDVVFYESYVAGSKDFTDLIISTKSKNPDAVMAHPTTPDAVTMIRQSKENDFNPKLFWLIRGASTPVFYDNLGKDAEYVTDSLVWNPTLNRPGNAQLVARYTERTGRPAGALLGPSYTVMQVIAEAFKIAGTLDKEKVNEAIMKVYLPNTVMGPVKFTEKGSPVLQHEMNQWQDGKYVCVYPPELAVSNIKLAPPWSSR